MRPHGLDESVLCLSSGFRCWVLGEHTCWQTLIGIVTNRGTFHKFRDEVPLCVNFMALEQTISGEALQD